MTKEFYIINWTSVSIEEDVAISYGVSCIKDGLEAVRYTDISTDKSSIEYLVKLCNDKKLNPSQLKDVVEDFVEEKAEL